MIEMVGLSGSLRRQSFNTALVRAAAALAPEGVHVSVCTLQDIPLYDGDLESASGIPPVAARLKDQIAAADGLLMATPEYNNSIPGVLKNAIDWASRPPDQPFARKPVAMVSASGSLLGGARAQYHLRQMLVFLDALPLNKPEVFVAQAPGKFDEDGKLIDSVALDLVRQSAQALVDWTLKLRG